MNITDVRVRKITKEGKMKAVVSVTLDNEFVIHDIKVIEGDKGMFNTATRDHLQAVVLEAYEKAEDEPEE